MKIKFDQNMDPRGAAILKQAGHEVLTVKEQNLIGAEDDVIAEVCQKESRCLVTLDLDFANTLLYPPQDYFGIVVLRHPRPTAKSLLELVRQFSTALQSLDPTQKLWIVEPGRIRVRE
jgi:predicted nuclease of predicted toxin-antitoxin system